MNDMCFLNQLVAGHIRNKDPPVHSTYIALSSALDIVVLYALVFFFSENIHCSVHRTAFRLPKVITFSMYKVTKFFFFF